MDRVVVGRTVLVLSRLGWRSLAPRFDGWTLCLGRLVSRSAGIGEPSLLDAFDMMKWETQFGVSMWGQYNATT